jgi:hypothetical protein
MVNFILTLGDLSHGRLWPRILQSLQTPLAALLNPNSQTGIASPAPSPGCGASIGFPSGPVFPGDQPSYWHHRGDTSSPRGVSALGWQATSHRHSPAWFPHTGGCVLPVHAIFPGGRPQPLIRTPGTSGPCDGCRWILHPSLPSPLFQAPQLRLEAQPKKPLLLRAATLSASVAHPVAVALPACLLFP